VVYIDVVENVLHRRTNTKVVSIAFQPSGPDEAEVEKYCVGKTLARGFQLDLVIYVLNE